MIFVAPKYTAPSFTSCRAWLLELVNPSFVLVAKTPSPALTASVGKLSPMPPCSNVVCAVFAASAVSIEVILV